MEFHQWQQQLRDALRTQRVAPFYAERLLEELETHFQDMQEAGQMNQAATQGEWVERLGDPNNIATQASKLPYPTWSGRHPLLGFIVGAPLLTLGLTVGLTVLVAFALIPIASGKTLQSDPWMGPFMATLGPMQVMIPGLLASLLICRTADRSGRSVWWGIVGCGVVALICAALAVQWTPAAVTPGESALTLAMAFPFGATWYQALVPIVVGLIYAIRRLRPRRPEPEAPIRMPAAA